MIDIVTEYKGGQRDFSRAHLHGANLHGANLHGANLTGANLRYAHLTGANLRYANLDGANLYGAHLYGANLRYAHLRYAHLTGAHLDGANLDGAHLTGAHLTGAHLTGAHLTGADLTGADLTDKERLQIQPLRAMLAVDGPIFAYKLLTATKRGPYHPAAPHELGAVFEEPDANTDEHEHCGVGLHVAATFDWILREPIGSYSIIAVVMHTAADIAAIPLTGGGKYRVRRYKVVSYLDRSKLSV